MATRGTNAWRLAEWGEACKLETIAVPIYAGGPKVQVRKQARDAVLQLGLVYQRHNYIVRRIGGYNCRKITGGSSMSSHAWALSVDVNDDTNPYRLDKLVTDMSLRMIDDVTNLRTRDGVQVWRWGGNWDGDPSTSHSNYDAMHFEVIATPDELAVGFLATVPVLVSNAPATHWPTIRHGADGPAVVELQRLLALGNTTGVGHFGPRTEKAVMAYQESRGMTVDGIVGPATWTALQTGQPSISQLALVYRTGVVPGPQKAVV